MVKPGPGYAADDQIKNSINDRVFFQAVFLPQLKGDYGGGEYSAHYKKTVPMDGEGPDGDEDRIRIEGVEKIKHFYWFFWKFIILYCTSPKRKASASRKARWRRRTEPRPEKN